MKNCWFSHDWTEENIEILPAPVTNLGLIKDFKTPDSELAIYLTTQPVLVTEVCRQCGKRRTRKIQ